MSSLLVLCDNLMQLRNHWIFNLA